MQALQTFNFKELPVRTVEIENEPYFVGKDIAEILGYARTDNAIRNHVDSEDKLTHHNLVHQVKTEIWSLSTNQDYTV